MSAPYTIQSEMDQGDAEKYFQLMRVQVKELEAAGKIEELTASLSVLGRNLVWSGKIREGYAFQTEACLNALELNLPPDNRLELSHNWGEIYIAIGKYNTAVDIITTAKAGDNVEQRITHHRLLSMAFNELGLGKEARLSAQRHFDLAKSCGSNLGMARALRNESIADMLIADDPAFRENGAKIFENITKAKTAAVDAENVDVLSAILYAEAMYYERLRRFDKAQEISLEGLLQTQQVGYVHREMLMSFKLATIASLSGDTSEALKWTDKTISLAKGDGAPFCYASYLKKSEVFKCELLS